MTKSLFLITLISLALAPFAQAYKLVNNGGDFRALEFVRKGELLASAFESSARDLPFALEFFKQTVERTKIQSVEEKLSIDGMPKDAVNTHIPGIPGGIIRFNREAWDSQWDEKSKIIFVLHEYLGIMDIDDERYSVSTVLVEKYLPELPQMMTAILAQTFKCHQDQDFPYVQHNGSGFLLKDSSKSKHEDEAPCLLGPSGEGFYLGFDPSLEGSRVLLHVACVRSDNKSEANYACSTYGEKMGRLGDLNSISSRRLFSLFSRKAPECENWACQLSARILCEANTMATSGLVCFASDITTR